MNQRKAGILLSYLYLVLNSVISIFFTPFMLSKLGNAEYGLYQLVHSISSYLVIANCGTGTAMTKFIAQYKALGDKKREDNYVFHNLVIAAISMLIIGIAGFILLKYIPGIFPNLTLKESKKAQLLFFILVLNIMLSTITHAFAGFAIAHEQFVFTNGWSTMRVVLRVVGIVVLLNMGFDSVAIVSVDFAINVLYLLLLLWMCVGRLKMRAHFYFWDKNALKSTAFFSLAILLQAIVNQINQNVDKTTIGIMLTTAEVTIYSVAMNIYVIFSQLPSSMGSVFLPKVTKMIYKDCTMQELTSLSARVGRVQFMIVGAALSGFILFGRNFMTCWVGDNLGASVNLVWKIALIVMIPYTIVASAGVCSSILDAKEKRIVKSIVLLATAVINILLTILLINKIGIIGAPIGTALATLVGDILIMMTYYHKRIGINVIEMYKKVFRGTLPALLITTALCYPLSVLLKFGWGYFGVQVAAFLLIYAACMLIFGFNTEEKKQIFNKFLCRRKNK